MIGVVLCGGLSTRMGSDKGLMQKGKSSWAESSYIKLRSLPLVSFVSINESQQTAYSNIFPKELLIVDSIDVNGPLRGILSAHKKYPSEDIFVLACDMQDITTEILQKLNNIYSIGKSEYDFYVFRSEEHFEALCGIYTSKGLKNILDRFENGKLDKHSMQFVLSIGKTYAISISVEEQKSFGNYNEPFQLNMGGAI